jgi:Leucine-rich repeat (LRR) protein
VALLPGAYGPLYIEGGDYTIDEAAGTITYNTAATYTVYWYASAPCSDCSYIAEYFTGSVTQQVVNPESELVYMPDPVLREIVNGYLGQDPAADITYEQALTLSGLQYFSDKRVTDLTGLEAFKNLTVIDLDSNDISDLTPLAGLTGLTVLSLHANNISDLTALSGLTHLRHLGLVDNPVSDLTPVSGLVNLTALWFSNGGISGYGQISDLSPLSGLTKLESLVADHNQISDLAPLSGLTSLKSLYLDNNQVSDLSPISGLVNLTTLTAINNQVSDLTPIAGLSSLHYLCLHGNQVSDLTPLGGLSSLAYLLLNNNQVTDLSPLASLSQLGALEISHNSVSDLTPLSGLTSLWNVIAVGNHITDLSPLSTTAVGYDVVAWTQTADLPVKTVGVAYPLPVVDVTGAPLLPGAFDPLLVTGGDYTIDEAAGTITYNTVATYTVSWHAKVPCPECTYTSWYFNGTATQEVVEATPNFIYMPDPVLREIVNGFLGQDAAADITYEQALTVAEIYDYTDKKVTDLTGLEAFTNLSYLTFGPSSISDLAPVAGLTKLTSLLLPRNDISDLSPLSGLTNLRSLNLDSNNISDLTPLAGLTKVTWLMLQRNGISDLSPLSGLTNLDSLGLSDNPVSDLTSLRGLVNLTLLFINNSGLPGHGLISDLTPLSGLTKLKTLAAGGNQISDLSPFVTTQARPDVLAAGQIATLPVKTVGVAYPLPIVSVGGAPLLPGAYDPLVITGGDYTVDEAEGTITFNTVATYTLRWYVHGPCRESCSFGYIEFDGEATQEVVEAASDFVYMPDPVLREIVNGYLGQDPSADITFEQALTVSSLQYYSSKRVTDLTGLEAFTNLTAISLDSNDISDLTPLAGLTDLWWLVLSDNDISDLSPLSGLTNLVTLSLDDNPVSDLAPLSGLVNLTGLFIDSRGLVGRGLISDLTPLSGLTKLERLVAGSNLIGDLTPLSGLTNLEILYIDDNQISDLSPVSGLVNLTTLILLDNQISDLTPVAGLSNLEYLGLTDNQVSDLTPLAGLSSLTYLLLSGNQVSDLSPLASLGQLRSLEIADNEVSDLTALSGLVSLEFVWAAGNHITDLSPLATTQVGADDVTAYGQTATLPVKTVGVAYPLPVVGINGVPLLPGPSDPLLVTGGDYTIDEAAGTITYNTVATYTLVWNAKASCSGCGYTAWYFAGTASQQVVEAAPEFIYMPDPVLRQIVNGYLGQDASADITFEQALGVRDIFDFSGEKVADLTGLEAFTNLSSLSLGSSDISDLTPLAGLPEIAWLMLLSSSVSDLTPLSGLASLTNLYLEHSQISDLSPISNLVDLETLSFQENQISDLTPLNGLSRLRMLDVWGNQISDLTPLSGLTSLRLLFLGFNQISDLSPISNLTGLERLWVGSNQVSDLTPIAGLSNLNFLDLVANQVSDLTPIAGLSSLTTLWAEHNQISDLSALASLGHLEELDILANEISDLTPLAGLSSLRRVFVDGNHITDLSPLVTTEVGYDVTATGQTATLPVKTVGVAYPLPVVDVAGVALLPGAHGPLYIEGGGYTIDEAAGTITYNTATTYRVHWYASAPCSECSDSTDYFSGSATQQVIEDTPDFVAPPTIDTVNLAVVSGTATPGTTVTVSFPQGVSLAAPVSVDGGWSLTPPLTIALGGTLSAYATDSEGNESATVTQVVPQMPYPTYALKPTKGAEPVLAGGVDSWTGIVTIVDSYGNPLPGLDPSLVTITVEPDGVVVSDITDQGDGTYSATFTSLTPGDYAVTTSFTGFTLGRGYITFTEPLIPEILPNYEQSSLTDGTVSYELDLCSPNEGMWALNGGSPVTFTATDAYGNPLPGVEVALAAQYPFAPSVSSAVTGVDGTVSVPLVWAEGANFTDAWHPVSSVTVTATVGPLVWTATVRVSEYIIEHDYFYGVISSTTNFGDQRFEAEVSVFNECGVPSRGELFVWATGSAQVSSLDSLTPATVRGADGVERSGWILDPGDDGVATLSVTDAVSESVTLHVLANTRYGPFEAIGSPLTLNFKAPWVDPRNGTSLVTTPVENSYGHVADATATIRDKYDNPVPGVPVTFTIIGDIGDFVGFSWPDMVGVVKSVPVLTDANGHATIQVTAFPTCQWSHVAVRATVNRNGEDVEIYGSPATVSVFPTGPSCQAMLRSTYEVKPTSGAEPVIADGMDSWTGIVTIVDIYDNPIPGLDPSLITIAISPEGVTMSKVIDNHDGSYSATFKSTTPGDYEISVSVAGYFLGQQVISFAELPVPKPSPEQSSVVVTPNYVSVGQVAVATVTVKDAWGNWLPGVVVSLGQTGVGVLSAATCTTGINGQCSVSVTGYQAGSSEVMATVGGTSIVSSDVVYFIAAVPAQVLSAEAEFESVALGGTQTVTAGGFDPGELVEVTLFSEAVALGTYKADKQGVVSVTFSVPAGIESGQHVVEFVGATSGAVSTSFLTVAATTTQPPAQGTQSTGSVALTVNTGGTVAGTGAHPGLVGILAAMGLVLAAVPSIRKRV